MTRPQVSVGMPVYNGEHYLAAAIESVLAQTEEDLELIISDNGSTDHTEEICRAWSERDPRIRYIRNDVNRGAAWNFNQVFEASQGTYFKWAAYDDWLAPEWLEECVIALDSDPNVVLAYTRVIQVDENNDLIQHWSKYADVTGLDPVDRLRPVLYDWQCLPVFGLIRRDALLRTKLIGGYDSSDRVLLGELAVLGRFHLADPELFYHRDHPDNTVHAYETQVDRGAWFDPKNARATTYWPNWRYHWNFALAILRAPLKPVQTVRALAALGMRMIRSRKPLLADIAMAGRALVARIRALVRPGTR
ncbi:MAG: glycosyltransferase [Gemmatimonadetes bacterium]|nr:glycosyltransferase [Gemmatimonadota bacterium]